MHLGEFVAGVRGIVVAGTVDGAVDDGMAGSVLKLLLDLESTGPDEKALRARVVRLFLRDWPVDGGDPERSSCIRRGNRIVWEVLKVLIVGGFEAQRTASGRLSESARRQTLRRRRASEESGPPGEMIAAAARASATRSGAASGREAAFGGGNTFGRIAEEEVSDPSRGRGGDRTEREEEREGEGGDGPPSPPRGEASAEVTQPRLYTAEEVARIGHILARRPRRGGELVRDSRRGVPQYDDDVGRRNAREPPRVETGGGARRRGDRRDEEQARGRRGDESRRHGGIGAAARDRAEYGGQHDARGRGRDELERRSDGYWRGGYAPFDATRFEDERYDPRLSDQGRRRRWEDEYNAERGVEFGRRHMAGHHEAVEDISRARTFLADEPSLDRGTRVIVARGMGEFRRTGGTTGRLTDVEARRCLLSEHDLRVLDARATLADYENTEEATKYGLHVGLMAALKAGVLEAAQPGTLALIDRSDFRSYLYAVIAMTGKTFLYRPSRPATESENQDVTSRRGARYAQACPALYFCEPPLNFCVRDASTLKFTSCNLDAAHLDTMVVLQMLAGDMPEFVVAAGVILETWFVRAHAIHERCQREGYSGAVAALATFLLFEASAQAAVSEAGGAVWGDLVPGAAYDAAKIAVEFTNDLVRDPDSAVTERSGALWFDMSKARRDESVKMRVPPNSAGKLRSYARRYEVATQSGGATSRTKTNRAHENQLNKLRAQHAVAAKAQTTRLNKLKSELTLANTKLRTANGAINKAKAAAAAAAAAGQ